MDLVSFQPLFWLLCLIPLSVVLRFSMVDRPALLKWIALALRVLAILLLILAICRPFVGTQSDDLHLVFLIDVSESVALDAARDAVDTVQACIDTLDRSDSWSLFLVADGLRPMENPAEATKLLDQWREGIADDNFRKASRLAEALLSVRLCFPATKARRICLFTDGRETVGAIPESLAALKKEQIDVHLAELDGLRDAEACIESIRPNTTHAFEGEIVRFTAKLATNTRMPATLRLLHRAVVVGQKAIILDPNTDNTVSLDVEMTTPGATHWRAELIPARDRFPINNRLDCTVTVGGKARILILHEKPRQLRPFRRALEEQGLVVDVRGTHGMPDSLEALLAFDALILANIPATDLSTGQMEMVQRYVTDFGGGLAMFGSNNSFGLGGYYKTPIEEVLPLTSRYEKEKEQPSMAMVLLIDKSGSMQGDPIHLARQAAMATVELLGPRDQIGVIGFDSRAFIACELRSALDAEAIKDAINTLDAGGGTAMYPGMDAAYQMLDEASAKIKHIILLSDGRSQQADHEGLASEMTDAGITLSTVALGQADRELLQALAEIGRGRYYETMDPSTIPQIFTKETVETSRSAVKEDLFSIVQIADHPLLAGFDEGELPMILGYVMTHVKPATQLLLAADSGDPLLAISRYGLGVGMAYTSDITENWGSEWLVWDQCGRFWAQAIRGIIRRDTNPGLHLEQSRQQDRWVIDITRRDPANRPVNGIQWDAQSVDSDDVTRRHTVEETGIGRYRVTLPLADQKTLSLRLFDSDDDQMAILHTHRPYPAEYNLAGHMDEHLRGLPRLTVATLRDNITPVTTRKPVSHICYLLALLAMVLGLLFRRI